MKLVEDYLVGLGFKTDQASFHRFKHSLNSSSVAFSAFIAGTQALAGALATMTLAFAKTQRELSVFAKNTGTSVYQLEKLGYIASMTGSSMESAKSSLRGLSKAEGEVAMGNVEMASAFNMLGVDVFNANHHLKSASVLMADVGRSLRGYGRLKQINILEKMNVDPTMIETITRDTSALSNQFDTIFKKSGIHANQVAKDSTHLYNMWTRMKFVFHTLGLSIIAKNLQNISFMFERFSNFMIRHLGGIISFFNGVSKIVLDVTGVLGTAIGNFIDMLQKLGVVGTIATGAVIAFGTGLVTFDTIASVSTAIVGGLAAAFNFLFAPITLITLGLAGLYVLFDDFFVFLEGGKSKLGFIWNPLMKATKWVWEHLKRFFHFLKSSFSSIGSFFHLGGGSMATPTGSGGGVPVSQKVHNQTTIIVNGAGDPTSVAKKVAKHQDKANRVRLGRPITR